MSIKFDDLEYLSELNEGPCLKRLKSLNLGSDIKPPSMAKRNSSSGCQPSNETKESWANLELLAKYDNGKLIKEKDQLDCSILQEILNSNGSKFPVTPFDWLDIDLSKHVWDNDKSEMFPIEKDYYSLNEFGFGDTKTFPFGFLICGSEENLKLLTERGNQILCNRQIAYLEALGELSENLSALKKKKVMDKLEYSGNIYVPVNNWEEAVESSTDIDTIVKNCFDWSESENNKLFLHSNREKGRRWNEKTRIAREEGYDLSRNLRDVTIPSLITGQFSDLKLSKKEPWGFMLGIQQPNLKSKSWGRDGYFKPTIDWHVGKLESCDKEHCTCSKRSKHVSCPECEFRCSLREFEEEAGLFLPFDSNNLLLSVREEEFV